MKTPLQEFYEFMRKKKYFIGSELYDKYNEILEKEKTIIETAFWEGRMKQLSGKQYYEQTFNNE